MTLLADHRDRRALAALAAAVAVLAAILVPTTVRPLERGHDAGFTYGYLRSVVLHGDLDFSDDAYPFDSSMPHTAEGYTHNAFPIGPSVWWAPAFVGGHVLGAAARVFAGSDEPAPDGRSWPYDLLVGFAILAVATIGLWATFAACRILVPRGPALAGTVAVWLAGPAVYYLHVNATQGHATAFAASALLLLAWLRCRERPDPSLWRIVGLGLLAGLLVITRWQYAVLVVPPAVDVVLGRVRGRSRLDGAGAATFAGAALLALLPQLIVWNTLYGSPLRPPRGESSGAFIDFGGLHLFEVLLSWRHGMLSWHPILAVGLVGLVVALRRHRWVAGSLLAVFVATAVINAGVLDWWGGVSFGARRFDGMWPVLALGVAVAAARVPRAAAVAVVAALALVNWILMMAFVSHLVPQTEAVRPGDLLDVLGDVRWLPKLGDWGPRKAAWVGGLAALALLPGLSHRVARPRLAAARTGRRAAIAGLATAVVVTAAVSVAAGEPGRFDGNVFEAGYFVPQEAQPDRTDRVVAAGDDVWTLIWAFPGFLPPGRYVATATGVEGEGTLTVRVDGRVVASGAVDGPARDITGEPFELESGFLRLDLRVAGGPLRVAAVRIDPLPVTVRS